MQDDTEYFQINAHTHTYRICWWAEFFWSEERKDVPLITLGKIKGK